MRRKILLLIVSALTVSCSGATSGGSEASTIAAPVVTTSCSTPEPTLATSTTVAATPATTPPPTTTTTLLDRNKAGERMQNDLAYLVALGVRESGSDAEALAADYIAGALEASGAGVEIRPVSLPTGAMSVNLRVDFGSEGRHVLLGAHFDSKPPSPGADDNGSGTVVLLELARRLAETPPRDQRVTIVFFGAEEILVGYDSNAHHFGSRLLAGEMADRESLPDLMISADMVGVGSQIVAATYLDTDPTAAELIVEAAAGLGLHVELLQRGDISDHEAFARLGVPSAFLWRPENPDYHLATDLEVRTDALLEDLAILERILEPVGS